MFNKLNPFVLVLIIIVLAGLVWWVTSEEEGKKRTFRSELSNIDTAATTDIYIYPKAHDFKEIWLNKNGGKWGLVIDESTRIPATSEMVSRALAEIGNLRSQRLAAKSVGKWREFEVADSLGTRVRVMSGQEVQLDIILGKFGFVQPRTTFSYVRLVDEEETYVIEGLIDMTFNRPSSAWRNQTFAKQNTEEWVSISSLPYSTTNKLNNIDGVWTMDDGRLPDSTAFGEFLSVFKNLSCDDFVDGVNKAELGAVTHIFEAKSEDGSKLLIQAWPADSIKGHIIHSSDNPDVFFYTAKDKIMEKVWPDIDTWFPSK